MGVVSIPGLVFNNNGAKWPTAGAGDFVLVHQHAEMLSKDAKSGNARCFVTAKRFYPQPLNDPIGSNLSSLDPFLPSRRNCRLDSSFL